MKKKISLRVILLVILMFPLIVKTVTSNNQIIAEVVEDSMLNPEEDIQESIKVRNSIVNYIEKMSTENNDIVSAEIVATNESESFGILSDESIRELEDPIYSGVFGTSSWKLFSDGSLYIGAGEFPRNWDGPPEWSSYSPKNVIIEGPVVVGERVAGSMGEGLFNKSSIKSITGATYLNTSNVVSMANMFAGSGLTELDVSGFDTSNVTDMEYMFFSMNQLTELDVSGFDTSNVTSMEGMFSSVSQLSKLDVSEFDTSNVTSMGAMFSYTYQLNTIDVSRFDTSKVTNMRSMFQGANRLSGLDVSGFDTSNTTDMAGMFHMTYQLSDLDVSRFDTSKVTDMKHMFDGMNQLTELDVSGFETSKVTDMSNMFNGMSELSELDLSGFDTSNVMTMWGMFNGTSELSELNLSGFDTSNVTNMSSMFNEMVQLRTLILGTKSIFNDRTYLPESASEGYWLGAKTSTIFNSSSDLMINYTGEFPDVYTREQEFLFDFSDDEENAVATITGYIGSKTEIDIPNIAINYSMGWTREIPVVSVGNRAFYEKKLNSVTFPASIETIGTEAFAHNNIEAVEFPEELTSIGESAFQINSLIELNIPDKVYEIGNRAFAENSSLSQVTLGDGIEKIGSGMFISAPLKTIEVSEEYLEKYRALLNSDVMVAAVVESPVLQVFGEDRYIDGTNLEMNLDYGDVLELGVISKNRYQMGSTYVWNTFTPIVQWYKNSKALADEVNRIFTINQVQEEDSGNYHAVVEETILEPITVNVSPMINPDIPPIDPTDSNPIFPKNPNPAIEALSLRFVSDIDFNEINVSNSDQRIYSKPTIDRNGQEIPNMVTVQDTRTVDKRDNWNLTVKQSGELMNGAQIIMTPYSHSQNKEMFGIIISNPVLVITSDFQSFAATDNSENAGIFSLGMHEPEAQGVQLEVPAKAAVGQYSTTLIWNLVSAP
ncbi:BspA family leucine-rich repeat surface protein [Carnobacterium maltaromaticum]|uniref:BspA family leucine-rich repeat surface protein n=1 Tax=Carnobacterium maltaromaticum TaxID=2751 RepID=UPI00191BA644|nr:BspA family leucine-rich repeat surface protein [Carnobacterium maltaromaticum]CAD5900130.1 exported hypothetical protein [Carnobacterium maltaromaticum]